MKNTKPPAPIPPQPPRATVADRVREMVARFGHRRVADASGVSHETVRRITSLGHAPPVRVVTALCAELGVNGDWLLLGEGPRFSVNVARKALREASPAEILAALTDQCGARIDELSIVERAALLADRSGMSAGEIQALLLHVSQIGATLRNIAAAARQPAVPPTALPAAPAAAPALPHAKGAARHHSQDAEGTGGKASSPSVQPIESLI